MKPVKFFSVYAFLITTSLINAQVPVAAWTKYFGADDSWNNVESIECDSEGNIICFGQFAETADLDPGPLTADSTAIGGADVFLLKLTSNGELIWAFSFGSIGYEYPNDLVLDAEDNIYIVGEFENTIVADPLFSGYTLNESIGQNFIIKYNPQGQMIYAKQIPEGGEITSVDLLHNGNVVFTGKFQGAGGPTVDLDPGLEYYAGLGRSCFVVSLNDQGEFVWGKSWGHESDFNGYGLDFTHLLVDSTDHVIVAGVYDGTFNIDPDDSDYTISNEPFNRASFILKMDNSGNFIWAKNIVGQDVNPHAIVADSEGKLYFSGTFTGDIDLDFGDGQILFPSVNAYADLFVCKLDAQGDLLWINPYSSIGPDYVSAMYLLNDNELFVGGYNGNYLDFDPGPEELTFVPLSGFFGKYDHNGDVEWAFSAGSQLSVMHDIEISNEQVIYTSGSQATVLSDFYGGFLTKWNGGITQLLESSFEKHKIYPNPADDAFALLNPQPGSDVSLSIFSGTGNLISKHLLPRVNSAEIDISSLSPGLYIVQIESENQIKVHRLIVQ